jgi:outer membrane protein OmpA-like peptidoglycan-associated protein
MISDYRVGNRDRRRGALCAALALGGLLVSADVVRPRPAFGETAPIPLVPGLTIVAAVVQGGADIEGLRTIKSVDAETVVIAFRWTTQDQAAKAVEDFAVTRIVRREDLAATNRMNAAFGTGDPDLFPGSTAIQTSTKVLEALKGGGETPFIFGIAIGAANGWVGSLLVPRKYYRGTLKRIEREAVPFSVLVNGERTMLPAIHASGTLTIGNDTGPAEFWWLDQPDNPLTLRWAFQGDSVQVVRIDTPPAPPAATQKPPPPVAPGLESGACRSELHGVYFDTGSAALRPESSVTISRVGELLEAQPDWLITIEGHTDNIGTPASNMTLSQRRAEAVRAALVETYRIPADHLAAKGFGQSQPVETNATIEGRARNRRVELSRKCR